MVVGWCKPHVGLQVWPSQFDVVLPDGSRVPVVSNNTDIIHILYSAGWRDIVSALSAQVGR